MQGNAADEVAEILWADTVRDDHHGEKRSQSGKQQRINTYYHRCLFQVLQLGMSDFAIDLS